MRKRRYLKFICLGLFGVIVFVNSNVDKEVFAANHLKNNNRVIVYSENDKTLKTSKEKEINSTTKSISSNDVERKNTNKGIVAGVATKKEVKFEKVKTSSSNKTLNEINVEKENVINNETKTVIPTNKEPLPEKEKEILLQEVVKEDDCITDTKIKEVEETINKNNVVHTPKQMTDIAYENAKTYLSSINIEEMKTKLGWTRIMCIGDSLTEGVQSGVSEPYPNSWPGVMGGLLNIPVENNGIGGSTIWADGEDAMCDRIVNCGYADAVFIMGGTNDWFFGYQCPMGDKNTPNTFTHDVNKLYNIVSSMYANADVFVILPLNTNGHAGLEPYEPFDVLRGIERTLAEEHGFNVIDLNSNGMFNPEDKEIGDNYFSDFCHLNTKGYEMFGTIVTAEAICMANN